MEVSSSMEKTASIWGLAVRMSAMSARPASRVNSVAYSFRTMLGASAAMVSVKPFLRSSATEPEVGTSRTTTVPSVPTLSMMYSAASLPIPSLSPDTRYTPSASMAMSKFTTVMPSSMACWMGTSMPSHWGKATMASAPQVFNSSNWVVISAASPLIKIFFSILPSATSSSQRFSA